MALLIRPLTDADRAALHFMFRRLGDESRYQRFLGPKHNLGSADLDILMQVDHWHREALIAWSPHPRAPIGVARYARKEEFDLAEVAVAVVDEWQRRGVGAELVTALRDRALRAGIRRFTVTLFRDNQGRWHWRGGSGRLRLRPRTVDSSNCVVRGGDLPQSPSRDRLQRS